jgi:uncharacterized protein YndB with AHSA1/START domain
MSFPDRVKRAMQFAHPPTKMTWAVLTAADGLAAWFGQRAAALPRQTRGHHG